MITVSPSDEIFATLRIRGGASTQMRITGASSLNEIVAQVSAFAPRGGMATLAMRNAAQGWTTSRNLYIR